MSCWKRLMYGMASVGGLEQ
uniref:Uncharacterized protein LOC8267302 n=1 Tax=Rhizophora mucronata TaxID=61149 RepID=A0A2P2L4D6_RHIMU